MGSLDTKVSKLIIKTSSIANYAESASGTGYLLYMQGATLIGQRFNARSLESYGEPFPIAEQVSVPPAPGTLGTFSASTNGILAYRTLPAATTELVWFDRRGNRLGTVGMPENYFIPALSADEKKLAVTRLDARLGTKDLWLFDLVRGTPARFTFNPAEESNPTWSPDGTQIAFMSREKGGVLDLYVKQTSGTSDAQLLLESSEDKIIESWSPDSRFILYETGNDLWALPLTGNRKPTRLLPIRGETRANISPNGKWIAYQSNESGRFEVYVQSFLSSSSRRWQVSSTGGEEPYWRRDGKEMLYVAGKMLIAVNIKTDTPVFESEEPKPLFELRLEFESRRSRYQPVNSGQRFLVNVPLEATLTAPITVVTNWEPSLRK